MEYCGGGSLQDIYHGTLPGAVVVIGTQHVCTLLQCTVQFKAVENTLCHCQGTLVLMH